MNKKEKLRLYQATQLEVQDMNPFELSREIGNLKAMLDRLNVGLSIGAENDEVPRQEAYDILTTQVNACEAVRRTKLAQMRQKGSDSNVKIEGEQAIALQSVQVTLQLEDNENDTEKVKITFDKGQEIGAVIAITLMNIFGGSKYSCELVAERTLLVSRRILRVFEEMKIPYVSL